MTPFLLLSIVLVLQTRLTEGASDVCVNTHTEKCERALKVATATFSQGASTGCEAFDTYFTCMHAACGEVVADATARQMLSVFRTYKQLFQLPCDSTDLLDPTCSLCIHGTRQSRQLLLIGEEVAEKAAAAAAARAAERAAAIAAEKAAAAATAAAAEKAAMEAAERTAARAAERAAAEAAAKTAERAAAQVAERAAMRAAETAAGEAAEKAAAEAALKAAERAAAQAAERAATEAAEKAAAEAAMKAAERAAAEAAERAAAKAAERAAAQAAARAAEKAAAEAAEKAAFEAARRAAVEAAEKASRVALEAGRKAVARAQKFITDAVVHLAGPEGQKMMMIMMGMQEVNHILNVVTGSHCDGDMLNTCLQILSSNGSSPCAEARNFDNCVIQFGCQGRPDPVTMNMVMNVSLTFCDGSSSGQQQSCNPDKLTACTNEFEAATNATGGDARAKFCTAAQAFKTCFVHDACHGHPSHSVQGIVDNMTSKMQELNCGHQHPAETLTCNAHKLTTCKNRFTQHARLSDPAGYCALAKTFTDCVVNDACSGHVDSHGAAELNKIQQHLDDLQCLVKTETGSQQGSCDTAKMNECTLTYSAANEAPSANPEASICTAAAHFINCMTRTACHGHPSQTVQHMLTQTKNTLAQFNCDFQHPNNNNQQNAAAGCDSNTTLNCMSHLRSTYDENTPIHDQVCADAKTVNDCIVHTACHGHLDTAATAVLNSLKTSLASQNLACATHGHTG